jgi:hypothetical protein
LATVAQKVVGQRFGHLGAAGIVGTEEKDLFFHTAENIRINGYIKRKIRGSLPVCSLKIRPVQRGLTPLREG